MKAVEVESLCHSYGTRTALDGVSFSVDKSKIFGLVGPNGGGKSTIFRILSTLMPPSSGQARIFGVDAIRDPYSVRRRLGVVFQSPALDKKLRVEENLKSQGHLYGMRGKPLHEKSMALLKRMGLWDRARDLVETLSGGLKRRLEIARALLHGPELLILDEPTTGLDPLARREVWDYLKFLKEQEGLTILTTTHLLQEAEACDEIVLLDQGKVLLSGSPAGLLEQMGGDVISVRAKTPEALRQAIEARFSLVGKIVDGEIRIERARGHEMVSDLVTAFSDQIVSVTVGRPTLEDLFIARTGRKLWQASEAIV